MVSRKQEECEDIQCEDFDSQSMCQTKTLAFHRSLKAFEVVTKRGFCFSNFVLFSRDHLIRQVHHMDKEHAIIEASRAFSMNENRNAHILNRLQ